MKEFNAIYMVLKIRDERYEQTKIDQLKNSLRYD